MEARLIIRIISSCRKRSKKKRKKLSGRSCWLSKGLRKRRLLKEKGKRSWPRLLEKKRLRRGKGLENRNRLKERRRKSRSRLKEKELRNKEQLRS